MKRHVAFLLMLCLLLAGCSGAAPTETTTEEAPAEPMTFEQFQEKYKRAEWANMLAHPVDFLDAFHLSFTLGLDKWTSDLESFDKTEEEGLGTVYRKEVILFNDVFEVTVFGDDPDRIYGTLAYHGEDIKCYQSFTVMARIMLEELGDSDEILINDELAAEPALQKLMNAGFPDSDDVRISWNYKNTKSGYSYTVWCYAINGSGTLYIW